jgi:hypothetical protein
VLTTKLLDVAQAERAHVVIAVASNGQSLNAFNCKKIQQLRESRTALTAICRCASMATGTPHRVAKL